MHSSLTLASTGVSIVSVRPSFYKEDFSNVKTLHENHHNPNR